MNRMNKTTNSLVAAIKSKSLPLGLSAAFVVGALGLLTHNPVHAATTGSVSLADDRQVTSLEALDSAVETLAARVTPAVVNVSVVAKRDNAEILSDEGQGFPEGVLPKGLERFFGGHGGQQMPQQVERGVGSGVLISPDGYIVTNNHVVEGATQIKVTLNDRRVLPAELVGTDKLTDLAVIRVKGSGLPYISWGDSSRLHPGQTVLAFGSPFGYFQFSVTRGIVSAVNRPNPYSDDARKPGGFIQTDAAINPGNSGGPLVNARGELVGINTFIISNSGSFAGAGFAIPSQIAQGVTEQLIRTGAIHHGYLGIAMNDVTPDNANFFQLPDATGAIVSQVTPESPAAKAGVKQGDVIRSLNGNRMENGSALQVAVSTIEPGKTVTLGLLRDGKEQQVTVKVGEFHAQGEKAEKPELAEHKGKLGLGVNELTDQLREQMGIPEDVKGVAVETVRPASPADNAGLAPGDVILEVDRHPVASAEKFASEVRSKAAGKDILLLVWSHGGASYRVVHPEDEKDSGM